MSTRQCLRLSVLFILPGLIYLKIGGTTTGLSFGVAALNQSLVNCYAASILGV